MPKAPKQADAKKPTAKTIFEGVKLLELNPRGQYLFVLNNRQISMSAVQELIDMCDKTAMANVKGAIMVDGDVNTAVQVIDIKDLKKEPAKNAKSNTTK